MTFTIFLLFFIFSDTANLQNLSLYSSEEPEPLECNFCKHSYRRKDLEHGNVQEPDCLNHLKFLSRLDLRKSCALSEKYCVSIVTNLNGFFVEIERDCAKTCKKGCEEHGFGLYYTTCTRCCQDSLCNEFDDKNYYKPLSANGFSIFLIFALNLLIFVIKL